ncbi:MAG: FKBP-type peptidyl-prolyl cis-trans isomerase [Chromatiales bacterium]|nr:FKBP-type peptidyl-prolyl cis-trans isomerase [Chromatiales bacterium]
MPSFPARCLLAPATLLLLAACDSGPRETPVSELSEDEKALYAFGAALGGQLAQQIGPIELEERELAALQRGLTDVLTGAGAQLDGAEYEQRFQDLITSRMATAADRAQEAGNVFLEQAASEPGAVRTGSGLVFQTLSPGDGASPAADDRVRVHYEGRLVDGTVFDSSLERGEPTEFGLNQVIPCWTEGVQRMQVGERARLVCPAAIAYGSQGAGGVIPPNATLIFEVELLDIL